MPTHSCLRLVIVALLFIFAVCPFARLEAKDLDVYDLDSLVYMSTDVIEAEIVRRGEGEKSDQIEVKVSFVHKGKLKGQTVTIAGTSAFTKPTKDFNPQPLAVGDRLVLFVRPVSKDSETRATLAGMRFVLKDQVYSFSQWSNPGPYTANIPPIDGRSKPTTLESFRKSVVASLRDTPAWAKLLEAKADQLDVPGLLKLLADRSKQAEPLSEERDYFTEQACKRIAERAVPEQLDKALGVARGYRGISILRYGFATTEGRDYLLAKVTDAKAPADARVMYAQAIFDAGHGGGSHGYMARVAKAARANAKHEVLCLRLVACLDYFGQGISQNKPPQELADLRASFGVLKEIYDTKPSQELQFAIEKATAWDQGDYEKLKSPCGKLISILRAAETGRYTKPEKRSLIFEYDYTTVLMPRDVEVQPSVVLVHQGTQKRYVLPSGVKIRGWSTGGGSGVVELPKDLPKGRYHVFFQLRDGETVTSTGHHFAADL